MLSCLVSGKLAPVPHLFKFNISTVPWQRKRGYSLALPNLPHAYSNVLRFPPRHVRCLSRVNLDLLSDLDEHGHCHSGARIELGWLGAALCGVSLEVGVGLHYLVDVVGRQLYINGPLIPLGYLS